MDKNYGAVPGTSDEEHRDTPKRGGSARVAWGLAALGAVVILAYANSQSGSREATQLAAASKLTIDVSITGEYATEDYSDYPWMSDYTALVEPHRVSTLKVVSPRKGFVYDWLVDGEQAGRGVGMTHIFKEVGDVSLTVRESPSGRTTHHKLTCKYVRREIRRLHSKDREEYFHAMEPLWKLSSAEGQEAFGSSFTSASELTQMHAKLAGAEYCDHMHDGLGFLTQHLGLGLRFEEAIQAINPKVSAAYWDFTIDTYMHNSGAWASLRDSPLWLPNWFGTTNHTAKTVTEGRWAYTKATTEAWHYTHNSYGFLRAPWNNNKNLYVTRSHDSCGYDGTELPSCESHFDTVFNYDNWFEYAWNLPYSPHGNVHLFLGGNVHCSNTFAKVEEAIFSFEQGNVTRYHAKYMANELRSVAFALLKETYRHGYLSMPKYCSMDTPFEDCKGMCDDLLYVENANHTSTGFDVNSLLQQVGAYDTISHMNIETRKHVLSILCEGGIAVDGDHLEAASPSDPSFWVIHPTIERLWMWKKIHNPFKSEFWPHLGAAQTENCTGHAANDVVPFFNRAPGPDGKRSHYTNKELYDLADPNKASLAYVYDNFHWDHCATDGYDMRATSVPSPN